MIKSLRLFTPRLFSVPTAVLALLLLASCPLLILSILPGGFFSDEARFPSSDNALVLFEGSAINSARVRTAASSDNWIKLQDGKEFRAVYHGSEESRKLMQSGKFKPVSLASADFNRDGYADLVSGYATPQGGALVLREANRQALAPEDQQVLEGVKKNEYIDPFLTDAWVIEVPVAPDFVETGDFTRDGNPDVLVAARGSSELFILAGDGHGQLSAPQRLALAGPITALATGNISRDDELPDIVVSANTPRVSSLLVFEGKTSLLDTKPTVHPMQAVATMLALGRLDDDNFADVAILAGGQLSILHGSAEPQSTDVLPPAKQAGKLEAVPLPFAVKTMTLGEFVWDRESRTEIAFVSTDGSVHIAARGKLDTRLLDPGEVQKARRLKAEVREGTRSMSDVVTRTRPRAGRTDRWNVVEDIPGADPVTANDATPPLLLSTRMSARPADDLLVMHHASREIHVISRARAHHRRTSEPVKTHSNLTLQAEQEPIAALPIRLNVDGRPGLVVLSKGSIAPSMLMPVATTFTVTRADDPAPNGCAVGDCSLREAVIAANGNAGADTIVFNAGINPTLTITSGGGFENAAATGDLDINDSVTITGNAPTTISTTYTSTCGDCKVFGVGQNSTPGLNVSFSGVTIQNGFNQLVPASQGLFFETGGGIDFFLFGTGSVYSMTNCTVNNNQVAGSALSHGAGINIDSANTATPGGASAGTVTLTNVNVTNNTSSTFGGGIVLAADKHNVTMTDCSVTGNTATGADGGGIWIRHSFGGTVNISKTGPGTANVSNNSGTQGGGISIPGNQVVSITDITISNNTATGAGSGMPLGGGIAIVNLGAGGVTGSTTLTGVTISTNHADGPEVGAAGGGVYFNGNYAATVSNCTISGNTSISGAGVFHGGSGTNQLLTLNSSTSISSNSATGTGGGLGMVNSVAAFALLNGITISSNTSGSGGDGLNQAGGTITGTGTNNVNGGDSVNISGGTFNYTSGTFNLTGNFTNSSGVFNQTGGTTVFNGTGAQSLGGTTTSLFNILNVNKTAGTLTLGVNTNVGADLTLTAGIFDLTTFTANRTAAGGTLTVSNGTTLKIGGTNTLPSNYTTHSIGATSNIDYSGTSQNVSTLNSSQRYGNLLTSGSATKTLAGNISIATSLSIGSGTTLDANSVSSFSINDAGNWTNNGTFTPRNGTVTFDGSSGTQTLAGNTTFFNLAIANAGATIAFGSTNTTVGNTLSRTAGTGMDPGTGTFTFTGGSGSIVGASAKVFNNLVVNSGASISNNTGGNLTIQKDFTNNGTFSQAAGISTTFDATNATHNFSGNGATTFGVVSISGSTTIDAGSHNFSVGGATFTVTGTFTGNTGTVTFNGGVAQAIDGTGSKNFNNLIVNNGNGVTVTNVASAVDASVGGTLTLTTNLTVASGGILQQSGTSAGAADVIGTVRRTDLGVTERAFGNLNNTITINSGTPPTQMDFNLVKSAPVTFPATVKVVPRDYTLTPTGGSGISATVKLRYIDPTELVGGITEWRLILWKNIAGTWTPQGGTVNVASNFVSLSGVSSFSEWAIAEGSDLTLTKANNVANAAVTGQPWNWTLTATNAGAPATFVAGQTILSDNLPNSNLNYGTPTVQNVSNITGNANISCSITSNDLTCTASGGSVTFDSNLGVSKFDVVFSATPQAVGTYQNPRSGGAAQIDSNNVIVESNEGNNTPTTNTVTVTAANTTTAITSDNPDPSVVGQPVTVQWNVTVNAPGSVGTALTGNVTVSDGTNSCFAAVSAGQCDITFTSAGAKNLTATYAGDSNYNGSTSSPATPHTVNAANTTTTITSDNPDPSTPGQSITVNYTVTANSPGSGTPTGNVQVTDGVDSNTCTVAAGTCALTLNTIGNRTITATYAGNSNFNTSNDTESHNVCGNSVVTSTADSGAGSLRQVIADACDGATITFNIAGGGPDVVTLTTGELVINKSLTITGTTAKSTFINGASTSRVFNITSGNVNISSLTIINGSVTGGSGAGILYSGTGTLTVANSTFTGNHAINGVGGAIATTSGGTLTIVNSTFAANTATIGGAINQDGGGTLDITNSTISGNTANGDVGGGPGGVQGIGGGINNFAGTFNLRNSIVSLNAVVPSQMNPDITGAGPNIDDHNLIGINPLLGPLQNNGGPTSTRALLPGSPALDAGNNPAATNAGLTTDQRGTGFPRIADSADADTTQTVDIGAFELHPSVENIPDKNTPEDTLLSFGFNIGDGTGALITSVTASSSNATLVPNLPANISVTGAGSTRTLNITPAANRNSAVDGTSTITVTVTATNGQIATDTFVLTVDAVNDAPSFVKGADQVVNEDAGPQTVVGWATSISQGPNETGQTLTFNVSVTGTTGSLAFSSAPAIDPATGNLTYTTSADTNGTANLSVTLSDSGSNTPPNSNTSGAQTFMITVNPINDPPSFTKGPDQNVGDNAGPQTVVGWATSISQGPNETGQTPLTFNVTPTGTTGTLTFSTPPAINGTTGTLTYTATNGTNGTATFDVTLSDNGGGTNTSAAQSFSITVNTINDPPVNTVPGAQSIPRNTIFTFTGANQISVADPDAILTDNVIRVSLTATNGALTLSGTAGLNFACVGCSGDGTADSSMVFEGTIPHINTALNGMSFTPTLNFTGAASVQIVSDDLGKTGTGGPQTDTDTVNITVTVPVDIYINEVLFNPPGTDAPNEYIELRGTPSSVIPAGTYLVAIEGDAADNPGDVQTIINLSNLTFGSNGFVVLLQNGNTYTTAAGATVITGTTTGFGGLPGNIFQADGGATDIEDSSVTFMLIQTGVAPSLTNDIDANDDGNFDGSIYPGWSVRDSISAMNGSLLARAYGAFSFRNTAGTGTGQGGEVIVPFIPSYVGRVCDSTGSTAADWVSSGVLGGAAPNWTLGSASETEPASFASKALNHIGASNFANLAPVNTVPGAQATNEDTPLAFTGATQISIADPDAGGAVVEVTLTAVNGTFSLSGIGGLSFTTGDGTNDPQMVFTGTIANINTALNNLTFTPPSNFFSPPDATLTILTEDQGNTGCGGNKTDSDTINITVNAVNDAPSFSLSGNPPAVNEDAGAQTVNSFATGMSQGPGESGQTLTFNVSPFSSTGNIAFSSGPAIDATTGNLTYTTSADTNGTATFSVTLSDNGGGTNTSAPQQFTITVNAVNDAPTFQIPSNPPAVNEDAVAQTVNSFATNFQPGPVTATDETGQTLVGYTVTANGTTGNLTFTSGPSINNAGTLTYTPTANTSGTATFNVVATDNGSGVAPNVNQSAPVSFTITVNGQNDAPVLDNSGNMTLTAINEDVPAASNPGTLVSDIIASAGGDRITDVDAGAVEGIAVTAVDNTNGTWQFSIDNGTNWTPFGSPNATTARLLAANATTRVRFLPNLNFNGTVDPGLTFRAWDQTSGVNGNTADTSVNGTTTAFSTATETASITVNPVNDNPTTIGIPPVGVSEDAADTVIDLRLFYNDVEDGAAGLVYTVQANTNPGLFTSTAINNANDNLTLDYAPNANGSAQLTIRGTDTGGLFVETILNVTVNAINDAPSFTKGPDITVQDPNPQSFPNWATNISAGPPDESGQTLTFLVSNNNNVLFSAQPAISPNGTLTFTAAAGQDGVATVTVRLMDNGGTANGGVDTSAPQTFTLTVHALNNPPTLDAISDLTINEDAPLQTVNLSGITPGPSFESNQTLTVTAVSNNTALIPNPTVNYTNPNTTGSLSFTPVANINGSATITVTVKDNGGTANGGVDTFVRTFLVTVNSVNDAPSFTKGPNQTVNEDAGAQTVNNWATAISAGPANESGQTVAFEVTGNTSPGLFSAGPAISPTGTLTYTPAANANGTATITIVLKDNGGTANGGVDTSAPQTFTITVNGVNDAPVNNVPGPQNIPLNAQFVFSVGTGNPISISDVDAGSDTLQVTIKATDGTITLNGTAGLVFTTGDGTDDPLMTFTGSLASINAALAGMKNLAFGSGVITITTNDLGHNGTGGPLSDTDTIAVTVADNLAPLILTIPGTDKAIAFDSVTFVVDPFALMGSNNFTADHRTHITIFALHSQLRPGETASAITAEADVAGTTVPLIVESVNGVPNFDWLTQIVFKFPDGFSTGGGGPHDAKIRITLRGQSSNQAVIIVVPAPKP